MPQADDANTTWERSDYPLYISTYNARSIRIDERFAELEYELDKINWYILGIQCNEKYRANKKYIDLIKYIYEQIQIRNHEPTDKRKEEPGG